MTADAKKLGSDWKLSDLAEALDRDVTTVRSYANKFVDEAVITVVGDDPEHDGWVTAPQRWKRDTRCSCRNPLSSRNDAPPAW